MLRCALLAAVVLGPATIRASPISSPQATLSQTAGDPTAGGLQNKKLDRNLAAAIKDFVTSEVTTMMQDPSCTGEVPQEGRRSEPRHHLPPLR